MDEVTRVCRVEGMAWGLIHAPIDETINYFRKLLQKGCRGNVWCKMNSEWHFDKNTLLCKEVIDNPEPDYCFGD